MCSFVKKKNMTDKVMKYNFLMSVADFVLLKKKVFDNDWMNEVQQIISSLMFCAMLSLLNNQLINGCLCQRIKL
jgi:hypothetical protein